MTDLEEVIREALVARADQAPPPDRLLEGVHRRRHRHRTTRMVVAVAAVAVATVAAVVVPLTLASQGTTQPTGKPTPTPAPSSDEQIVGFHGIEITVPATWKINLTVCAGGRGTADTVVRDLGATVGCEGGSAIDHRISSVQLDVVSANAAKYLHDLRPATNAHGVHLQRGTYAFSHGVAVVVPAVNVLAVVDTSASALNERIINSIRPAQVDVAGCQMHVNRLDPPPPMANPEQLPAPVIFPPAPLSMAVCHYEDYWLVSSATATATAAEDIVRVANSVPPGWVHGRQSPPLSSCTEAVSLGPPAGQGYVLFAHYPGGATVTAWAHIGLCGRLGITNGVRVGQLTPELASVVTRPLRNGYAMPGSLVPGPG